MGKMLPAVQCTARLVYLLLMVALFLLMELLPPSEAYLCGVGFPYAYWNYWLPYNNWWGYYKK